VTMQLLRPTRLFFVWMGLLLATWLSWTTSKHFALDSGLLRRADIAIIVVAFIKVRFVGLEFMELRHAPLPARIAFELWVVALPSAIAYLYAPG
jgi:hypothetical protein